MKSIINKKNVDTTKQPLFFGEGLSLQRYDRYRYKKLFDLFLQQMSFFWRPEEVDLSLSQRGYMGSGRTPEIFKRPQVGGPQCHRHSSAYV